MGEINFIHGSHRKKEGGGKKGGRGKGVKKKEKRKTKKTITHVTLKRGSSAVATLSHPWLSVSWH